MKRYTAPIIDIKKYGGKQVALFRGRVIASGKDSKEVLERALRRLPKKNRNEVWLFTVPTSLTVIYLI